MAGDTKVVGHRGNPVRFPDNSLEGILDARAYADMVEIDVRRTADDVLILSHDAHVDGKAIVQHPRAAFPQLVELEELLEAVGAFPLNIEIKNWPADPDFDPSLDTARRIAARARDIDLITCFHWPTVEAARAVRPDVATGLLIEPTGDLTEAISAARAGGHVAIAPHWSLIDDPAGLMAAAGGLAVNVWTVNDVELVRRLAAGGISAIITDDPARIRTLIETIDGTGNSTGDTA